MHVLRDYTRSVTLPVLRTEKIADRHNDMLLRARRLLVARPSLLGDASQARLDQLLDANAALKTVYEFREQLVALWEQANVSNERLISQLKEWCARAEASGIKVLQEFSATLRGYIPAAI
jgi:stearoyl-CoA desaturase (delta-9 desaturase)